jgi:hypothetical protein
MALPLLILVSFAGLLVDAFEDNEIRGVMRFREFLFFYSVCTTIFLDSMV